MYDGSSECIRLRIQVDTQNKTPLAKRIKGNMNLWQVVSTFVCMTGHPNARLIPPPTTTSFRPYPPPLPVRSKADLGKHAVVAVRRRLSCLLLCCRSHLAYYHHQSIPPGTPPVCVRVPNPTPFMSPPFIAAAASPPTSTPNPHRRLLHPLPHLLWR